MSNKRKILVGIRDSKLSKAQTGIFIDEADKLDEIRSHYNFEIKTIKTTGDIHNTSRLDRMGGKGLFIKEIEKQIQKLQNETSEEFKKQYFIAKSKIEALNSKHYERI